MADVYMAGDLRNGTTFEMDGSVYVTSNSTNVGGSTSNTLPLYERIVTSIFSFKYFKQSPNVSLFKGIWSYVSLSMK